MLTTLIYGSNATQDFSQAELVDLLNRCRENNRALGITGMLLYHDGNFMQVLEGEADAVDQVYKKITDDPRHENALVYVNQPITQREFGGWEMGFVNTDDLDADAIPGYSNYIEDPEHSTKLRDASYAYAFLEVFRDSANRNYL